MSVSDIKTSTGSTDKDGNVTCYTLNLTGKACATLIDYIFDIFHPSDEMLVKIIEARLKRRDAQ